MKKKIPLRQCVGCREMKSKKELIRIIKTVDNDFMIDTTGRKNGRGAYICHNCACLEMAMKAKGLERSFQCAIPLEVYEQLKKEMSHLETK